MIVLNSIGATFQALKRYDEANLCSEMDRPDEAEEAVRAAVETFEALGDDHEAKTARDVLEQIRAALG
ncbi:hypothetical protein FKR81_13410 [Lentzea tibetensis]|uniref:Tetratricopeptide repeat protein n=1 Tax=Lentzea tibetensis TaxID=2591470 RepID=A0A563EXI7_9PSEU|nr:hypothetical protein [Lentzea tibetensis]TWP51844.1 hypothetical protein FKR81_13410 [Lentzea tibetensis]